MAREKIKIKKIDNLNARQVTFSKRRRGLFKKAYELSVLCDSEVALIVFSSTGKLFHFASSSMKEILDKHKAGTKSMEKLVEPSLDLQLSVNSDLPGLSRQVAEKSQELRRLRGEDLEGLDVEELQLLDKSLIDGLNRVIEKKNQLISNRLLELKEKEMQLVEENAQLRRKLENSTNRARSNKKNGSCLDQQPVEIRLHESCEPALRLGLGQ